jgi:MFS family permease
MAASPGRKPSLRAQAAIYGSGMLWDAGSSVIIPLWLIALQTPPFAFGVVMGCRALLPCLFAIHGGTLMDRLGGRTVMLAVALAGLVPSVLFPTLPYIWVAAVLQLITGFTNTMTWVGAQTTVSQFLGGDRRYFGRLSFYNRIGAMICPLMAGAIWDFWGAWGGFGFLFVCGLVLVVLAAMLPKPTAAEAKEAESRPRSNVVLRDWLPHFGDYVAAFRLMAIPAVLLTVVASILNVGTGTIQQSFYVVYLEKIGMTGTLIGILVASPNIIAITGTLWLSGLLRWLGDIRLLNLAVFLSILCTTTVPLFTAFFSLFALGLLRGWSQGVSQPLMISIPSTSVPPGAEGASVGLRITMNRLVQTLTPLLMGAVVEAIGLENGFYAIGGSLMLLVGISLYLARHIMPPWPARETKI